MAISQFKSKKKITGGRYKYKVKKKKNLGNLPTHTKLGKKKIKVVKGRSALVKGRLLQEEEANVYDPKSKKCFKLKILNIVGNPANRHFVRRNIITKGAIIKTEKGEARITSKPGQEIIINAVLISK
jgi:small subunit ribosomal protein S8e